MVYYQKLKGIIFALLVIHPFLVDAQRGYTLTNESGDIFVTVRDTLNTGNGMAYRAETIEFPDSAAAAVYLESLKDNYFSNAYKLAQLAHADSVTANRIRLIGTDSGLFSIAPEPPLLIELPEIITVPEPQKKPVDTPKKKTTKPKKKTKKQG